MVKLKVSQNDLKDCICYAFGYCDIHGIVNYRTANAYNSGIYGWNYDVYFHEEKNVAIITGYRPYGFKLHDNVFIKEKNKSLTGLLSDYGYKLRDNKKRKELFELLVEWCILDYDVYHMHWLKDEIKKEKDSDGYYHNIMKDYQKKLKATISKVKRLVKKLDN